MAFPSFLIFSLRVQSLGSCPKSVMALNPPCVGLLAATAAADDDEDEGEVDYGCDADDDDDSADADPAAADDDDAKAMMTPRRAITCTYEVYGT